jgi:tetratricopeptide (TPR) repeat protein
MPEYRHHLAEAERLLHQVDSSTSDSDPVVLAELAKLALERRDWAQADAVSLRVLQSVSVPTEPRLDALATLGQARFQQHRFQEAVNIYRELTVNRYNAQDWYFLGLCEQNCDLTPQAIQDLQHSMRIDPSQLGAMDALTAILQSVGATQDAESLRNRSGQVRRLQTTGN